MATKATINKALLNIANMDTHYYADHNLTVAQHPSETDTRLMIRVIAFILNASDTLALSKGLSQEDEPEIWEKNWGGEITLWIELGQPDIKRIKKACGRSEKVIVYTYQEGMANAWWTQIQTSLTRFNNLSVIAIKSDTEVENMAKRAMSIQANISDNELTLIDQTQSILITQERWM